MLSVSAEPLDMACAESALALGSLRDDLTTADLLMSFLLICDLTKLNLSCIQCCL